MNVRWTRTNYCLHTQGEHNIVLLLQHSLLHLQEKHCLDTNGYNSTEPHSEPIGYLNLQANIILCKQELFSQLPALDHNAVNYCLFTSAGTTKDEKEEINCEQQIFSCEPSTESNTCTPYACIHTLRTIIKLPL